MSSTAVPVLTTVAPRGARGVLALLLVFAVVWFSNLDYRRLVHPDEGRYAEIPREMAQTGDWVTPRLDGIKYFEKPPLQYWITAAAYNAFGVHHWTARLWPALSGFLGVLFIAYVGFRLGGRELAFYAATVLGGTVWYVLNAHILTLDAGLTFWMTVALGSLFLAQRADASLAVERCWMWVAWAALALAVLSKGLIGIVLPGASLVLYSILNRDWALWRRLHIVSGATLFFAIAAPWFILVSLRNHEFVDFFFIHEHFTRFLSNEHRREGPWWYFVPVFIIGIMPWLPVFVRTIGRMWSDAPTGREGFHWQRFALVWSAFIFVFFSASGSKLSSYILPMFPALALPIAQQMTITSETMLMRLTLPLVALMGILTVVLVFFYGSIAPRFADVRQPLAPLLAYGAWLKAAAAVAFVGGIVALRRLARGRRTEGILAIALSTFFGALLVLTGHDELAESRSMAPMLSRIVAEHGSLRRDVPFYTVHMYDQTLPYYLGRTVTPVDHADELALGLASEPEKAVATLDEWRARWLKQDQAYAVMDPDEYAKLAGEGIPMRELGRDPRRIVVSRR